MSRPPNSATSQSSPPAAPPGAYSGSPPPPQRASTHSIPVSYAYGAPTYGAPARGSPRNGGGGGAGVGSGGGHHRNLSLVDDAASVLSGSTALSESGLGGGGAGTGRVHESAAVRYARIRQRTRDTGSPFLPPPPPVVPQVARTGTGQDTSVNIAIAFKEATRGGGGVVRGREGIKTREELQVEETGEEEEEDEEVDDDEGLKETQIGVPTNGPSKKRKKRTSKDPSFKPAPTSESDEELGEGLARGKAKRPKQDTTENDDGHDANGIDQMAHKKASQGRRKSGDATYRPTELSEAESSEYVSDDDHPKWRKKGRGRASGSAGSASIAIPIGRRDSDVWMGKKRKGRKGGRLGTGEPGDEDDEGLYTGSGEGGQEGHEDDLGGMEHHFSEPSEAGLASTSFFLRPRSPSQEERDPAFAAFDRSLSQDDSGIRGSSYDYSEEERIVAALEQQKRRGAGPNGTKRRNRLPGPPIQAPFLGGIAEEDVDVGGVATGLGHAVGAALRPLWGGVLRIWRMLHNPYLDWGKILRVGGLAVAGLVLLLAVLLSRSAPESPSPELGRGFFSYVPFFGSSKTYRPPSGPADSLSELVHRLSVLEGAMGKLSILSDAERARAERDRRLVGKVTDQVLDLETTLAQEQKRAAKALAMAEAAGAKESQELSRDVRSVRADLETLVARVRTLSEDQKADEGDLRKLESGVTALGKDIASLGTKVAQVSKDMQAGVDAERIAKIALDAIEARLPSRLAVQLSPSGKLEIDPAFWKHLRDAFVEKSDVDALVDRKVTSAVAKRPASPGGAISSPPVIKQPTWQEFLVDNEAALRSWIGSDISARAGSDAIITKRAFLDLLHREIKALKVDFEAKSNENVQKIGEELLSKVAKQEKMRRDAERQVPPWASTPGTGTDHPQVTIKSTDGQNVTAIIGSLVDSALVRYSKDVLARPDFALATSGGRVIPSLTSPTYEARPSGLVARALGWVTGSGTTPGKPPVTALLPQNSPGWCWPFEGTQGQLGILLSRRVIPSDFTIEHISVDVSLDGDVASAPKDFEVWAVVEGKEDGARLAEYRSQQLAIRKAAYAAGEEMDDTELSTSLPPSPNHLLLAAGSYDVTASSPIQTFPVTASARQLGISVSVVVVKILSNHGDAHYTCLYRVRLSGHAVPGPVSS